MLADINKLFAILEKVVLIDLRGNVLEAFVKKVLETFLVLQDLFEGGFLLFGFGIVRFLVCTF
jgi:hypothetical protein